MRSKPILLIPAALSLLVIASFMSAQAPVADSPAIEAKVESMLARLTLQQKLELIGGEDSMYIRAEKSAGFPRLKMSDGPDGIRTWGPDTAYAGGIALAAAWDPGLAQRMGVSIAQDARARGVNFLLGPGVNIYRAPMNGRNFEYFGEDPFLAAHTVVPYIEGVQSQGVIATVKHYAANNEEWDRHNASSDLDERTLREIYLPAFEAAVKVAHAGSVMNSYNLINGVHATQNPHLNLEILKKEWGFDGILMSDWDATYDAVGAANNGLDLEMPSGRFMSVENLTAAIKAGKVTQATIDEKIRRIFRTAIRFGFLDREQLDTSIPKYNQQGREVALDEARESIVLLKNQGSLLPLDAAKLHTIAVIGPDAWPAVPGAGGSSTVTPYAPVDLMTGVSNYLGSKVKVLYARGLPEPEDFFRETQFDDTGRPAENSWFKPLVRVETFDTSNFSGKPSATHYEGAIANFRSEEWTPPAHDHHSIRYTAKFTAKTSEDYLFLVGAGGSDAYRLMVDGKTVIDQPALEGQAPRNIKLALTAGKSVDVQLDYQPDAAYPRVGLGIRAVSDLVSADAKKIAAQADAVIVAAGFDPSTESEGFDRTFELPWGQDELIEAVAAANKNTIVTLTAGGGVDMHGWLEQVPALLHNWYPGQEGGTAISEVVFGARSPEGHLPVSFETSWEENPVHDSYYAPAVAKGQTPHVKYTEGVFLGYRYYTTMGKKPLFPFGYGMSYTTFSFSHLLISPTADGATVSFDVANTGKRAGAEVAQVYIGDPAAPVKRPERELKGYQKVRLKPGEMQHVQMTLDARAFSFWDENSNSWHMDSGPFTVFVGDSSANTPLTTVFKSGK